MSRFRHNFRVFEVAQTMSKVQFEVVLVTIPDVGTDRRRQDRISTGQPMGRLRLIVDLAQVDHFPVGKKFAVAIEALESEEAHEV
jgi:hypothetical protein